MGLGLDRDRGVYGRRHPLYVTTAAVVTQVIREESAQPTQRGESLRRKRLIIGTDRLERIHGRSLILCARHRLFVPAPPDERLQGTSQPPSWSEVALERRLYLEAPASIATLEQHQPTAGFSGITPWQFLRQYPET